MAGKRNKTRNTGPRFSFTGNPSVDITRPSIQNSRVDSSSDSQPAFASSSSSTAASAGPDWGGVRQDASAHMNPPPTVTTTSENHQAFSALPFAPFNQLVRSTTRAMVQRSSTEHNVGSACDLDNGNESASIRPTPENPSSGEQAFTQPHSPPFNDVLRSITGAIRRTSLTQVNVGSACDSTSQGGYLFISSSSQANQKYSPLHSVPFLQSAYSTTQPTCQSASTEENAGSTSNLESEDGHSYIDPSSGGLYTLFPFHSSPFLQPGRSNTRTRSRISSTLPENTGTVNDLFSKNGSLSMGPLSQSHQTFSPSHSALFSQSVPSMTRGRRRSSSTCSQRFSRDVPIHGLVETNFQTPGNNSHEAVDDVLPSLPSTSSHLSGIEQRRLCSEKGLLAHSTRQRTPVAVFMEELNCVNNVKNDPPHLTTTISSSTRHIHHVMFRIRMLSALAPDPHPKPDHVGYEDPLPIAPRHMCRGRSLFFVNPDRCSGCIFPDEENPAITAVNVNAPSMASGDVDINVSIDVYNFDSSRGDVEYVLSSFVSCHGHWVEIPENRLKSTNAMYVSQQPVFLNVKYPPYRPTRPSGLSRQKRSPVGILEPMVMNNTVSYPTVIFLLVNEEQTAPLAEQLRVDTRVPPYVTVDPTGANTDRFSRHKPQFDPRHYSAEISPGNHVSVVTTYTLHGFDDVTLEYFITRQHPAQNANPDIVVPMSGLNFSRGEQHTFTAVPLGYFEDHSYGQIAPATVFTITEMNGAYLVIVYQEGPIHVELMFMTEVPCTTNLLNNSPTPS